MSRSEVMARVKGRDTTPEKRVRALLRTLGHSGYRLHRRDLPGAPDIAFLGRKRAIFVHGCFWHGHDCPRGARRPKTNVDYWSAKIARNRARDAAALADLEARGWRVFVVWECALRDVDALVERLRRFMVERSEKEADDAMQTDPPARLRSEEIAQLAALAPEEMNLSPTPRAETLAFLLTRRSTPSKTLVAPGPDDATLQLILRAGLRVPDYGKLAPWRLILISPGARAALADGAAAASDAAGRAEEDTAKTRATLLDAPTMVVVVSSPAAHPKISRDEQVLSAGVVCATLVNAALASGFGAQWLTGWAASEPSIGRSLLGLGESERIVGFVHIGTPRNAPPERPRPTLGDKLTVLAAPIQAGS